MNALTVLKNKNICWYPSAGIDFRDLLMIDENFLVKGKKLDCYPDIYVHTDCVLYDEMKPIFNSPHSAKGFVLYKDQHTNISIISAKRINQIKLQYEKLIEPFEGYQNQKIQALYLKISIISDRLGTFSKELVYFVCENGMFAIDFLLRNKLTVSHIVRVRYGESFGGAKYNGNFIMHAMEKLNTKYLICSEFSFYEKCDPTNELLKKNGYFGYFPYMKLLAETKNQGWSIDIVHWWEVVNYEKEGKIKTFKSLEELYDK